MSDFVVSARKYRPGNFEELVGQDHISQTLKNAIKGNKIAHAFLFCGPRGTGKTSSARILARILNCENVNDNIEPCNQCSSCLAFTDNASFNIAELDAASNNSVEAIRNLNDQVRIPPQNGKYRIFIIDEVHMLSAAAFNAFLKTLEEPPPYAIFILATTEKHKILPTILSRCQIFDFKRIEVAQIIERLKHICEIEGIQASDDALNVIAQKADGAMRDALSIYDKIVSFSDGKISYENVLNQLNVLDYDYYFKVIKALQVEDMSGILILFDQVLDKGFEADVFINGLASHIRDLLVSKDPETIQLMELSKSLQLRYQEQAQSCPSPYLINLLHIANQCDTSYRLAKNKRLHVEMALIRMTFAPKIVEGKTEIKKKIEVNPAPTVIQHNKKEPYIPQISVIKEPEPPKSYSSNEEIQTVVEKMEIPTIPKMVGNQKFSMPSVGSIEDVKLGIIETEAAHQSDAKELTQINLEEEWNHYSSNCTSPSLQATLRKAKISLEEEAIYAKVGSKMAQDFIRKELALTEHLRTVFNAPSLQLIVKIDSEMAKAYAKTIKKPLTVKDKYDGFVKINPLVNELRRRFDLKLDQ
ncbi:MAG: DNA polymerase III subunit gamma/tau [Bacteroidia bacterium]|nr:DNA polymerase III subunit gamma/tau [Bacteroidia bacterium]